MDEILENVSKLQILQAAQKLFAAQGFEGTSVGAIAKLAGVNKATIYYYFESKQAILESIIEQFMEAFTSTTLAIMQETGVKEAYKSTLTVAGETIMINSEQGLRRLMRVLAGWVDHILDFFESKRDILRIMIAESIKDGENQGLLFRLSDSLAEPNAAYRAQMQDFGLESFGGDILVMKFFAGFLPIVFYAVCADAWERQYTMSREALRAGMTNMFMMELEGYFRRMESAPCEN